MRILVLVTPEENYMCASVHRSLDHKREHRPLLGVLSVASYLKRQRPHHELKFVDCRALEMTFAQTEDLVHDFSPDIVGLTTLTFNYCDTVRLARRIKKISPQTKTIVGGWHVTLYAAQTLAQNCFDFVVHGEGERSFVELVDAIELGSNPAGIAGIGFKRDDQLFVTPTRSVDRNLDEIGFPDFDLTDIHLYSHVLGKDSVTLPMESSRGCPYACTFCDIRRTQFRTRSPELIADELGKWRARGVRSFFFVDDNVTVNKKRAIPLFRTIRDQHLGIEFKVSSRVDGINEEIASLMTDAGVSRVSLGIETSKQKYLDYMQKEVTVEQVERCLDLCRRVGLPVFAFMMLGFPGQRQEEMFEEVAFLTRNKIEYASFSVLTIYPKTELYRIALQTGQLQDDPWPAFVVDPRPNVQAPYINGIYTPEELQKIQLAVTRRFYFSPRVLYRRILEVNSWHSFRQRARLALRLFGRQAVRV